MSENIKLGSTGSYGSTATLCPPPFSPPRHAPRQIGATLPSVEEDPEVEIAREVIKQTNQENSRKLLNKANIGRKDQKLKKDSLIWVRKEVTDPGVNKKLLMKWIGPYKITETLREGSTYVVENVFTGARTQRRGIIDFFSQVVICFIFLGK